MAEPSKPVDPIPPGRRAVFDEFVYNRLPRHLLHVKTVEGSPEDIELQIISGAQVSSIFREELSELFRVDQIQRMSNRDVKTRLDDIIKFAIFSHRWFPEGEPSYYAIDSRRPFTKGYHKLLSFCVTAAQLGCRLAWSDTCCIDKTSSAELDEAIRSMFRWYRCAHVCIVHLSDAMSKLFAELEKDVWFTRGWTLQELLAPKRITFYGKNWNKLTDLENDKDDTEFMQSISRITNIPIGDLRDFKPGTNRIRERMSWASRRTTTRTEDIAYSLIGIFDVNLPIAYGEGTWAFHRLMEVIIHRCDEWGIFAWAGLPSTHHSRTSAIPHSPAGYHIINVDEFPDEREMIHGDTTFALSRQGLQLCVMVAIGDMERKEDHLSDTPDHYEFSIKPSYAGPTFTAIRVEPTTFIDAEGNESSTFADGFEGSAKWAIGILNYRAVEPEGQYGKLEGKRSYVCFLLRHRPSENIWERVPTANILIVDTLFTDESREPLQRLWL